MKEQKKKTDLQDLRADRRQPKHCDHWTTRTDASPGSLVPGKDATFNQVFVDQKGVNGQRNMIIIYSAVQQSTLRKE